MILSRVVAHYNLIDYLWTLRTRWPLVLLTASLVLLSGAALRKRFPPLREASVGIELEPEISSLDPVKSATGLRTSRTSDLDRQASELRSRALLSEVVGSCGLLGRWNAADESEVLELLEDRVRVEVNPENHSLRLAAKDLTPGSAAVLANAIAARFLERKEAEVRAEANARVLRLERELEDRSGEIDSLEARLVELASRPESGEAERNELRRQLVTGRNLARSLEAKLQLAILESGETESRVRLSERAEPSATVASGPLLLTLPILLLAGVLAGVGVAVAIDRGNARWTLVSSLMERLEIPVAGFAPLGTARFLDEVRPPQELVEVYRDLRHRLERLPAGDCVFLSVMALGRDPGVTDAVANLACVLADGGRTTLVIDADFRSPKLHACFDAANHPGLSDFLSGEMRLEETVIRTKRNNLWFMPSGPLHEDPGLLLNGRRMGDLVWDLRSRFDFILLLSPSIHVVADAAPLVSAADFTAVVTPYAGHSFEELWETRTALETLGANLAAVVLTLRTDLPADGRSSPRNRRRRGAGARP